MELLTIVWTRTAVKQRNYVFDYWNERNQNDVFSTKLNKEIKATTKLLQIFPHLGKASTYPKTKADNRQTPKKLLDFLIKKPKLFLQ